MRGWNLFSLVMAALLGGYALATATGVFLGGVLPMLKEEAVLTGFLVSFAVYAGVALWVFHHRRPLKAWLGLLLSALVLTVIGLSAGGRL